MDHNQTLIDPELAATPFYKALRWRVHDPEDALWIAATHRRHAADARSQTAAIESFRDWSRATGLESQASQHDEMARLCERHAADLQGGATLQSPESSPVMGSSVQDPAPPFARTRPTMAHRQC